MFGAIGISLAVPHGGLSQELLLHTNAARCERVDHAFESSGARYPGKTRYSRAFAGTAGFKNISQLSEP